MHCVLLGAGYATRLYPLTRERPKPLLPVGGVPILSRICGQVRKVKELSAITIISNHRFVSHYENWLRDYEQTEKPSCTIQVLDDRTMSNDDRLGAIGDLNFFLNEKTPDDDLLVVAGDNLFDFPLQDFVTFGMEKGSAIGLKDLKSTKLVSLYGAVELDSQGHVVDFEEKPPQPRTTLISIGVYFFGKSHIPLVDRFIKEGHSPDRPGDYIQWLHKQIDLHGYVIEGEWFDIGDIDSYNEANQKYLESQDR
jgi:glucose-1-phosphate thymidylyltransferase